MNEKWMLITSAFHLRRSIGIAKQLQWTMIPYPTDFQSSKKIEWKLNFDLIRNFYVLERSSHEWLGLVAYYFLGRKEIPVYRNKLWRNHGFCWKKGLEGKRRLRFKTW